MKSTSLGLRAIWYEAKVRSYQKESEWGFWAPIRLAVEYPAGLAYFILGVGGMLADFYNGKSRKATALSFPVSLAKAIPNCIFGLVSLAVVSFGFMYGPAIVVGVFWGVEAGILAGFAFYVLPVITASLNVGIVQEKYETMLKNLQETGSSNPEKYGIEAAFKEQQGLLETQNLAGDLQTYQKIARRAYAMHKCFDVNQKNVELEGAIDNALKGTADPNQKTMLLSYYERCSDRNNFIGYKCIGFNAELEAINIASLKK